MVVVRGVESESKRARERERERGSSGSSSVRAAALIGRVHLPPRATSGSIHAARFALVWVEAMVGAGGAVRHPADTRVTFKLGLRATISAAASWNTRARDPDRWASVEGLYSCWLCSGARNVRNLIN